MRDVLQSTARKFKIYMADSTSPTSAKTGLSSFTVYLSKDGGAENTVSPTITERGHGWYEVTPSTSHRDTLGENAWTFVATGAVDFPYKETVVLYDAQLSALGALTTLGANAPASWINAAAIATDAITAAKIAASAFNGKGDWLTTLGTNAPASWINAAAIATDAITSAKIAAAALNGKGDWATVGAAMTLTSGERNSLAGVIETYIVNEADATAVLQAVADKIAADWIAGDASPVAVAAAVRTNLATELARIDVAISSRGTGTALDAAGVRSAVGLATANLDTQLGDIPSVAEFNARTLLSASYATAAAQATAQTDLTSIKGVTTKLDSGLVQDGAVWQWTVNALELAPAGGGGGGGLTAGQQAQLDAIEAATARIRGSSMQVVSNVRDGGRLELTLGDDHETVVGNDLPVPVDDPGGLLYARLTAVGTTLSWSAGQATDGNLITGTVSTPTHASDVTTIVIQVANCAAAGNTLAPYTWQLARTIGGRRVTELQGTLSLRQDMFA